MLRLWQLRQQFEQLRQQFEQQRQQFEQQRLAPRKALFHAAL